MEEPLSETARDASLDREYLRLRSNFALLVRVGGGESKRLVYRLKAPEIAIGRVGSLDYTLTGDIVLEDAGVSRQHCRLIRIAKGRYAIADCGSSNGTFVNGQRVDDNGQMLEPDDRIDVGSVQFIFNPTSDEA